MSSLVTRVRLKQIEQLIEKGKRHARKHSWSEAAEMVISLYEELGASFSKEQFDVTVPVWF